MEPEIIPENKVKAEMERIGVSKEGIGIMLPKSAFRVVKLHGIRNAMGNILKQEMLSIGGDVALNRGCVNCSVKESDVLVMGTKKQFNELAAKMRCQVLEGKDIAKQIEKSMGFF